MEGEDADVGELDYHVTFPPALSSEGGLGDRPFSPALKQREAVVILLGWVGCQEKHLLKYSNIYHSCGLTTIRYTAPRKAIFFEPDSLKETAYKILELQYDLGLEDNPILVHAFSNGGGMVYRFMTELLHNPDNPQFADLKLAGCIMDSAPCDTGILSGTKALFSQISPLLARLVAILLFIFLYSFGLLIPARYSKSNSIFTFVQSITNDLALCPRMYIYSKTDKLCSYQLVENVIAKQQERGIEVKQVCFESSPHVMHFVQYPDDYKMHCIEFVNFCLERYDQLAAEGILSDS